MDAFVLIFKGLQQYGFHNHFVVAILLGRLLRLPVTPKYKHYRNPPVSTPHQFIFKKKAICHNALTISALCSFYE